MNHPLIPLPRRLAGLGLAALIPLLGPARAAEPPQIVAGLVQAAAASRADWHVVAFPTPFDDPPVVVMGPLSSNDTAPATVRVRNVTEAGFEFRIDEWAYLDGVHAPEEVSYLALPQGTHALGGFTFEARWVGSVGGTFQAVPLTAGFTAPPVVLAQIQTPGVGPSPNGDRPLTARVANVGLSAFSVRLQAEEAFKGTLSGETVAIVAVSTGSGLVGPYRMEAGLTARVVNQGWTQVNFAEPFDGPILLGHLQTAYTTPPVALRLRGLTATSVSLKAEAEQSASKKTSTSKEVAGFLVLRAVILDADADGMPDEWELAYGLNPNDPADASLDPDGDGYSSLEEFQRGSDPITFTEGANGGTVALEVISAEGFEKDQTPARLRIHRSGSTEPVRIAFTLSGSPDSTRASATAADYVLSDGGGGPITGVVNLPLNATEADLVIHPVADTLDEVPEALVVTLVPGTIYAVDSLAKTQAITLRDARNTPENQRLFVAYLGPQGTATTLASGLSTVLLQGDNATGLVSLSFGGLTGPETAVHMHLADPTSGPAIESLPLGQVTDHLWTLRATGGLATDQAALEAFLAGRIYVNVHSADFPSGEIRGDYRRQQGSTELQVPPPPPPIPPLAGDALDHDIARFLTQATFGPTRELLAEVRQMILDPAIGNGDRIAGMSAWLDRQMDTLQTPPISFYEYVKAADAQEWALYLDPGAPWYNPSFEPFQNNRRRGWWTMAVKGGDHLRQRVAFALSELYVVSERDGEVSTRHYGLANYYDMLARNAFGSFRTLLEEVSLHPIMGRYLSHLKNQKQIVDSQGRVLVSPDENYAREVMQLFSIGLVLLHLDGTIKLGADTLPIPTYDQDDISELARVLTGWSFSKRNNGSTDEVIDNTSFNLGNGARYYQAQWMHPMKMFPAYHDTAAKTIVGGVAVPAGQTGEQDLALALDTLAAHPNTAPFIARRLIQRLVTSNPSRGYLYRVAKTFQDTQGNLAQVIKAILLDYEARSPALLANAGFGKQKEPLLRYVATLRALGAASRLPLSDLLAYGYPASELAKYPPGTTRYRYGNTEADLAQSPLRAPSVFNWFSPDYSPGGFPGAAGLVAPEFQLTTENQVIRAINYHYQVSFVSTGQGVSSLPNQASSTDDNVILDLAPLQQIYNDAVAGGATVAAAITRVVDDLDLLLTAGHLQAVYGTAAEPNPRSILINTAAAAGSANRVKTAVYLLLTTPEFIIQK